MVKTFKPLQKRAPLEYEYTDTKDRKMISVRLPEALIDELKDIARSTDYKVTEVIQLALDQFCQIQARKPPR